MITVVVIVLLAVLASAGCATRGDVRAAVKVERTAREAADVDLRTEIGTKANMVAVATALAKVRGDLAAEVGVEKQAREHGIAQLVGRLSTAEGNLGTLTLAAADHGRRLKAVEGQTADVRQILTSKADTVRVESTEKQVQAVAARAISLTRRVGKIETTHYDHWRKIAVQLFFPTARLAADGSFVACAEILPATKTAISNLVMPAVKDGMTVARISGFADSRPFVDGKGKTLPNSDELNTDCALARAEATQKYLIEMGAAGADTATTNGMGKTTRFGSHDGDRSVVVELVSAPPAPPATKP